MYHHEDAREPEDARDAYQRRGRARLQIKDAEAAIARSTQIEDITSWRYRIARLRRTL
jgi:hypothetical protein